MLTDKRYNEVLKPKMPADFILIKEYQMWGECPTIKNHSNNQVLFWLNGEFIQPKVMLQNLLDNWRPVHSDEVQYFERQLESQLLNAQKAFELQIGICLALVPNGWAMSKFLL